RTFASLLYEAEASPAYVMAQMGHTSSALALEVYARKMQRSRDTGARIDALIRGGDWTASSVRNDDGVALDGSSPHSTVDGDRGTPSAARSRHGRGLERPARDPSQDEVPVVDVDDTTDWARMGTNSNSADPAVPVTATKAPLRGCCTKSPAGLFHRRLFGR